LHEIESQNARALGEITQAEERCHAASGELATVTERLAAAEAALAQHQRKFAGETRRFAHVESDLRERQEQLRQAQSAAFAGAQDLSRVRNELTALDLPSRATGPPRKTFGRKNPAGEERVRLESRLQEFTASVEVEKLNVATTRGSVEQRQNRLRELQGELHKPPASRTNFCTSSPRKRSRLTVLEQLGRFARGFRCRRGGGVAPVALGHRLARRSHPRAG
jgi:septation ring formation regulator EzrA